LRSSMGRRYRKRPEKSRDESLRRDPSWVSCAARATGRGFDMVKRECMRRRGAIPSCESRSCLTARMPYAFEASWSFLDGIGLSACWRQDH
jgi:hypothetical protein